MVIRNFVQLNDACKHVRRRIECSFLLGSCIILHEVRCRVGINFSERDVIIFFLTESLEFKGIQPDSQIMESPENVEDVNCQTTEWSSWSKCLTCRGYTVSTREIMVNNVSLLK